MTKSCEFAKGVCIHCGDKKQGECEGWNQPPARKWAGLTHEKARELVGSYGNDPYNLAYKIEEALREKNHD